MNFKTPRARAQGGNDSATKHSQLVAQQVVKVGTSNFTWPASGLLGADFGDLRVLDRRFRNYGKYEFRAHVLDGCVAETM
jgi:hypothetical protein